MAAIFTLSTNARFLSFIMSGAMLVLAGTMSAAARSATEAISTTSNEVIRLLRDEDLKKPWRMVERRRQLEAVIGKRLSYEEMSKRALGEQWKRLSEKERQEFVDLFKTLLANTYATRIEGYAGEQIQFINERQLESGYAEVHAKLVSKKTDLTMDFRLFQRSGDWLVYDIVVDGVGLVNNYRGQFAKIIRNSSYADLLKKLRNKAELPESP